MREMREELVVQIRYAIGMLERLLHEEGNHHGDFVELPADLRWKIMAMGASIADLNFWIRRDDPPEGGRWYTLTEIETGYEVGGVDPREACENYFKNPDAP